MSNTAGILYMSNINRLKKIIDASELEINIENFESKFVIITYWWGGEIKINHNFERPCPIYQNTGNPIIKKGITYAKMAERWKQYCKKNKCNFICQEYPEFAQDGGYQLAINAKPYFIKKALEICKSKNLGVVYIDTDMCVHKYPSIFDMENIDYMCRGWNMDPRTNEKYETKICFDPLNFETSGGIMYFGQSPKALGLLSLWIEGSKRVINKGKADDRILSLFTTSKNYYLEMNILELPIEYLWLTMKYEAKDSYMNMNDWDKRYIVISHPECLTEEETALEKGAASDRKPIGYERIIEDTTICNREGGYFWQYIVFDNAKQMAPWRKYFEYIKKAEFEEDEDEYTGTLYNVIPFNKKYGIEYKDIVLNNERKILNLKVSIDALQIKKKMVNILYQHDESEIYYDKVRNILYTDSVSNTIIVLFDLNISCLIIPQISNTSAENAVLYNMIDTELELICAISNEDLNYPEFKTNSLMYMSHTSKKLRHLLLMIDNSVNLDFITKFQNVFRKSLLFILMIRNKFICNSAKSNNIITKPTIERIRKTLSFINRIKSTKNNANSISDKKLKNKTN